MTRSHACAAEASLVEEIEIRGDMEGKKGLSVFNSGHSSKICVLHTEGVPVTSEPGNPNGQTIQITSTSDPKPQAGQ